uniref:Uncharacterized protein n=1 Tax=Ananas comosus var. bracteatus TaxID=296719 RepID=A0A6V7PZ19_ANACO|nr:unnamed protein product [Ananas comosus var. bracteatus]
MVLVRRTVNGFASGLWARRNRMSSPGWSTVRQNRHRLGAIDGTWFRFDQLSLFERIVHSAHSPNLSRVIMNELWDMVAPFIGAALEQVPDPQEGEAQAAPEPPREPNNLSRNRSLENSLLNRILRMEDGQSSLLLKEEGNWKEVKDTLHSASTQGEYNALLDCESLDLQKRELRESCTKILKDLVQRHPHMLENCVESSPEEAILSFLEKRREEFEAEFEPEEAYSQTVDQVEIEYLLKLLKDVSGAEESSFYFHSLVKEFFSGF